MDGSIKMQKTFRNISLVLALIVFSVHAAAVTYTHDRRVVIIGGGGGDGGSYSTTYTPAVSYGVFNHGSQTSSLTSSGFSASGSGSAYSDYGYSYTQSFFDVTFTTNTYTQLSITGYLDGSDGTYGTGYSFMKVSPGDTQSGSLYDQSVSAQGGDSLSLSLNYLLILAPGEYRIVIGADPYFMSAYSSFGVTGTFTPTAAPVPVPAAAYFMLSGLSGLALMRRKIVVS